VINQIKTDILKSREYERNDVLKLQTLPPFGVLPLKREDHREIGV